jgi:hypothetical protein
MSLGDTMVDLFLSNCDIVKVTNINSIFALDVISLSTKIATISLFRDI